MKGEKSSQLKIIPETLKKIETLKNLLFKLETPTQNNPTPY